MWFAVLPKDIAYCRPCLCLLPYFECLYLPDIGEDALKLAGEAWKIAFRNGKPCECRKLFDVIYGSHMRGTVSHAEPPLKRGFRERWYP